MSDRYFIDLDEYEQRTLEGPCFICEIVAKNPDYPIHKVYEDENAISFLDKYPIFRGHTLVASRLHQEQVTGDFYEEEYLELQRVIYRVAEAVRSIVAPERIYVFTLGSNQGNAHVHWHIVPLPPGIPYREQQFAALRRSEKGIESVSRKEQAALAASLRQRLEQ